MVDGSNASTFPQYSLAQAGLYPDPTQWSNPYSTFGQGGGAMPGWPTQYGGTPTNAATGTTLNSNPGYSGALQALANPGNPITPGTSFTPQQATAGAGNQGVLNNFIQQYQGPTPNNQQGIGGGSSGVSMTGNNPFAGMMQGIGGGSSAPTSAAGASGVPGLTLGGMGAQPAIGAPPPPQAPMQAPAQQQSHIQPFFYSPGGQISGGAASVNAGMQGGQNIPGSWQINPAYAMQQNAAARNQGG
jgi:hypothetical protein